MNATQPHRPFVKASNHGHTIKAIIIGGTSGIGLGLASEMVAKGYRVGATGIGDLDQPEIQQLCIPVRHLDGTSSEWPEQLTELILDLGGLDLLVLSAGHGNLDKAPGAATENHANQLNIQFFTEVANWAFRFFLQQGYGHFVAITSFSGLFGSWVAPAYHAAKAYQITYLEGLRQKAWRARQAGKAIYVTDIRPGFVDTPMTKGKQMFWVISKEEAGRLIFRRIRDKREYAYVSGRWRAVAWLIRLLPGRLRTRIFSALTTTKPPAKDHRSTATGILSSYEP
ncbi:MAG: SDR family NAD(P)-dependent oxidoreductase [Lewinella sp.]|nr:SDR family NAD(P)-dependent oxidoreductase [Lewinella sp.]